MGIQGAPLLASLRELPHEMDLAGDPATLGAHAIYGYAPGIVAAPRTALEVAEVLRAATATGAAVVPWGGGTRQALGLPPERVEIVLSLARMNRVVEYEPADLTISVEAGATVATVNDLLARHGQMLPLDPPLPERATIGGTVATGGGGPRRLRYGTARDLTIGIEFARPDGAVARAGGRVVKNVAGYDLMKMHFGALGTLGVLTTVNFKVLARPVTSRGITGHFRDAGAALAAIDQLDSSTVLPAAMCVRGDLPRSATGDSLPVTLLVLLEGAGDVVPGQVERVAASIATAGGEVARLDAEATAAAFTARRDFTGTVDLRPGEAVLRFQVAPSELGNAVGLFLRSAVDNAMDGVWQAHATGTLDVRTAGCYVDGGARLLTLIRDVTARGVGCTVLGAGTGVTAPLPVWGSMPSGIDLMRALKRRFDPGRVLNPGRYVGGI